MKKNLSGFTLIEMMIVIAIVGIMTAIVMTSLNTGRTRKALETSAHEFAGAVREAQNYSLSGRQISGNDVCAFSLKWVDDSTYSLGYTVSGSCGAVPTAILSYSLKNAVTLGSFNTISFSIPFGAISYSGSASGPLQVSFTKSSIVYYVCVYPDGKVLEPMESTCPATP